MARYPLSLPNQLKQEAEALAAGQEISLNQFVLWAVAEKVGSLRSLLDDPAYPRNRLSHAAPTGDRGQFCAAPICRVQTIVVATKDWGQSPTEIADNYGVSQTQVEEALAFYQTHGEEIDAAIASEDGLGAQNVTEPRLHLDADASQKQLHTALTKRGHDVTRTPNSWVPLDASDEAQLLGATAQGRCIFTFNIEDFVRLAQRHSQHGEIVPGRTKQVKSCSTDRSPGPRAHGNRS